MPRNDVVQTKVKPMIFISQPHAILYIIINRSYVFRFSANNFIFFFVLFVKKKKEIQTIISTSNALVEKFIKRVRNENCVQ
jgi:hypothetical protein